MERKGGRDEGGGEVKEGEKEAQTGLDKWNNSLFHLKIWVVKSAHAISSVSSCWTNCCGTCLVEDSAAMDDDFPFFFWIPISQSASEIHI